MADALPVVNATVDVKSGSVALDSVIQQQSSSKTPATLVEAFKGKLEADKPAIEKPAEEKAPLINSESFAALARKERAFVKKQQEFAKRQGEFQKSVQEVELFKKARAEAQANPLKLLEFMGVSYQQLTDFVLNGQKPTADMQVEAVRQEVERLKQEKIQEQKRAQEAMRKRQEAEFRQTSEEFSGDISKYVADNADKYELTRMYGGEPIIRATIEQHFKNTKEILDIDKAADLVEAYLEEQVKVGSQSKKFQAKQTPKDGQEQPSSEKAAKPSTPTLTNGLTSSAPSLLSPKTEKERIERALAALK